MTEFTKGLITGFLLTSLLFSIVTEVIKGNIVKDLDIKPTSLYKVNNLEDRIVSYAKNVNKTLDENTARLLASTIIEESEKNHVPVRIVLGVIKTESHFNPNAASSESTASGLFQVIPFWHKDKIAKLNNKDIFNVVSNTKLGVEILGNCFKRHGRNVKRSLLCYNGTQDDEEQTYANLVLKVAPKII